MVERSANARIDFFTRGIFGQDYRRRHLAREFFALQSGFELPVCLERVARDGPLHGERVPGLFEFAVAPGQAQAKERSHGRGQRSQDGQEPGHAAGPGGGASPAVVPGFAALVSASFILARS